MKKSILIFLFQFIFTFSIFSEFFDISFTYTSLNSTSYIIDFSHFNYKEVSPIQIGEQTFDLAFKLVDFDTTIEYLFLSQKSVIDNFNDFKFQSYLVASIVLHNLFNIPFDSLRFNYLSTDRINLITKSDLILQADIRILNQSIPNPSERCIVYFYCKKDLGIVCQLITYSSSDLFNDVYNDLFNCFVFTAF